MTRVLHLVCLYPQNAGSNNITSFTTLRSPSEEECALRKRAVGLT